jgi:hypothetical protein
LSRHFPKQAELSSTQPFYSGVAEQYHLLGNASADVQQRKSYRDRLRKPKVGAHRKIVAEDFYLFRLSAAKAQLARRFDNSNIACPDINQLAADNLTRDGIDSS